MNDKTHDDGAHASSEIGKRHIGAYGWATRGTCEVEGISNKSRVEKSIPYPPDHGNENEHREGSGKSEQCHRNDLSDEAGKENLFSGVEVQYPSTEGATENEGEGHRGEKEPGVGHPVIQGMKGEEGGHGTPDHAAHESHESRWKRFTTHKGLVLYGFLFQRVDSPFLQFKGDEQ